MTTPTFDSETKIWEGPKVDQDFDSKTSIGVEVLRKLNETPERVIYTCYDDGISMTCGQVRLDSIRIAQNLSKLGFKKGDVFGFMCANGIKLPAAIFGSILIGAPVNPLDTAFKKDDIKQIFSQTSPKLIFCDADVYETLKIALTELDSDAMIITMREKIDGVSFIEEILAPTGNEDAFEIPQFDDAKETLAAILVSSGASGASKGVNLSHAHILGYYKMFNFVQNCRSLSFSPIYWSTGLVSTILTAFKPNESKIITSQPFSVEVLVKIIKKYDVNFFQAAPYQLSLLVQSPQLDPRDFVGVQIFCVLGGIVKENLRKEFRSVFQRHPLVIGYGMSECCMTISSTSPTDKIDGLTVGAISPNISVKVVNESGENVDIGGIGEILAKPEFKFLGYYNNQEASANAVDSKGFLKTGDVGNIDENGCIFIIDRKKEIMKHRGYQINPSEIENIIESIEGVELVSVVGIPDPVATNLPAAVVVKRPEFEELTEQFIADFVAERLPEYKHLHGGVHFIDELPMSPTGKIQKRFVKVIAIREYKEKLALQNYN